MVRRQRKHIWKVFSGLPEKFGIFRYCTGKVSRRFRSGANLRGGTHMDVGGGPRRHTSGPCAPKSPPPLKGIGSNPEGIRSRSLKRRDHDRWGRKEEISFPPFGAQPLEAWRRGQASFPMPINRGGRGWLLGNVAWKTKKFLRTRKIYPWRCIAMRGGVCLRTLVDRKRKR